MVLRNLEDLSVFIRIIDTGSFTATAQALGLSPTTVSKQIARLEKNLGIVLFVRSTRSLRITPEGKAIAEKVRAALTLVEEAAEIAKDGSESLTGLIRLTAPVPLGRTYVAAAIAEFRKKYPSVGFILHLTDKIVDLYKVEMDLAIRVANLTDSGLIARRLTDNKRILVASPDYLRLHGELQHPEELINHNCLLFSASGNKSTIWSLHDRKDTKAISLSSDLIANNGDVLRTWCTAGLGIALRETWDVVDLIRSKKLTQILPEWQEETSPINVVRAGKRPVPQRIKSFIEFLTEEWRIPPWDK
ncbi:LysR family transcriptional regulator [Xenorhabdus bovienii]|uniref:Regulatory protein, LysR:LysR,substrate-binding n=1 Tax=Xenorhabdus bovienii str. kraussei Becker Underwood TaxID=1398204 RepID=A0A077PTN0_XENBV|nr:LysR family transcriptional regulator [Xenorhabdus bovienii]MDE9445078.1 LysR family transcriptional regulator [Xenorhabdus bovienii]MDE9533314.1 LysR family transcriptional regulator [Xenorhabdus bovienii]MDE9586264.1 LysR family transcriptional regulator [Xenorhabdus bovienii]CDH23194.1 Regulatory protein, LysR:LysR,substrate-binding [Xenorhabdus bovienii str. kraussei Becker Underwood]